MSSWSITVHLAMGVVVDRMYKDFWNVRTSELGPESGLDRNLDRGIYTSYVHGIKGEMTYRLLRCTICPFDGILGDNRCWNGVHSFSYGDFLSCFFSYHCDSDFCYSPYTLISDFLCLNYKVFFSPLFLVFLLYLFLLRAHVMLIFTRST